MEEDRIWWQLSMDDRFTIENKVIMLERTLIFRIPECYGAYSSFYFAWYR